MTDDTRIPITIAFEDEEYRQLCTIAGERGITSRRCWTRSSTSSCGASARRIAPTTEGVLTLRRV